MNQDIKVGLVGEAREKVLLENTAQKYGSGLVEAYATPAMIALMESAASNCVAPYLAQGQVTVGISVDVKHMAATPVGMEVVAKAELIEIDRRRLTFKVIATDGVDTIGEGIHQRFIVERDKFYANLEAKKLKANAL